MNSWLARRMYFTLQYLRGEPVGQALDDVRRTEFASLDALRFIQAERQLTQLRFALRYVPWYQRAYAPFADQIETARTWQDVNHLMGTLPVVERDAVMEAFDEFASQNASNLKTYPDRTSGSSGTPLMFACDQTAWAYRHALLFRCMEAFGVNVGEPYALFFGLHWNMGIRLKTRMRDLSLNRVRISAYDIEPKSLNRHLRNIREHGPTHFIGYPSAIYDFCSLLRDRGLDLRNLQLKAVFLTAEPLRSHQRGLIEETTASKCVNIYGSAEGGLNAFECPHGSLHLARSGRGAFSGNAGRAEHRPR